MLTELTSVTQWAEMSKEIKAFPYCVDSQPGKNQELKTYKTFQVFEKPEEQIWGDKWFLLELPKGVDKNAEKLTIGKDFKLYEIVDNKKE